jgi:hypothetical protein
VVLRAICASEPTLVCMPSESRRTTNDYRTHGGGEQSTGK